jgi:hypothetical protein
MELTTKILDHVIIFWDGSKIFVTKGQNDQISQKRRNGEKSFSIDDCSYDCKGVNKQLTLKQFYDQYPDQMPETRPQLNVEEVKPMSLDEQAKHNQAVRNGLIQGLEREIAIAEARGEDRTAARAILESYKKGRANEHNNSNYWVKVVEKYKNKTRNESEESHYQFALKKSKNNLFA